MTGPPSAPAEPAADHPVEPGPPPRWWEETPAEAARADDRYWDSRFDRDED
ncbi:hypothetical protein AB0C91_10130 [Streptomyces sp. NPDC048674]|uniref:hypothetical protein n=1 Tax=Streptomyces sp. NPDC048674 TaxID=3155491 RepID=UPI00342DCD8F